MRLLCISKISPLNPIWQHDPITQYYINNLLEIDKIYEGEIDNSDICPAYTIIFNNNYRQTVPAECFIDLSILRQEQIDSIFED
jgi:hypothetical protein